MIILIQERAIIMIIVLYAAETALQNKGNNEYKLTKHS